MAIDPAIYAAGAILAGPSGVGTDGQVLASDGLGATEWIDVSGGGGSGDVVSAGLPGGQTINGGTASGENLTLKSNPLGDGNIILGTTSDVVASAGALRVGGAAADRIVLTADVSGNPEIQAFNPGAVDARLTARSLPTSPVNVGWYANCALYVDGRIYTTGAFEATGLTALSASGSPAVRIWDSGVAWCDFLLADGTGKARFLDTSGNTLLEFDASGAGAKVGFLGAASVARPTVSGSHGSNAALQSLLTALAGLGLITNSATA